MELEHQQLTLTICRLVAYLVANIVRDEREYLEFGLPFLQLIVEAQYGEEDGAVVAAQLNDQFCPLVGHGISLFLEEDQQEEGGFTHIHSAELFLTSILNQISAEKGDQLELFVHQYLNTFLKYLIDHDVYDARTRQIMRRMCDVLNVSGVEFRELENSYWYSGGLAEAAAADTTTTSSCSSSSYTFYERFNIDSKRMPAASVVKSFRFVRIAFISVAGAVLMALSGAVAAPAITSTVLPLIYASDTLAKASIAFTTCLTSIGFTGFEVIPGLMSTYGALEAGKRMLHRTAPMAIDDFSLLPLLVSPVPVPTCTSINSPLLTKNTNGGGNDGNDDVAAQPIDSVRSDVSPLSSCSRMGGEPMCILVCGHLKEGTSAQELWARRGFFVPTPTVTTATESLVVSSSSSSSGTITAVLHQTIEAGVGNIIGYRFAAAAEQQDLSPAVDELIVSIEAHSVSALDQCPVSSVDDQCSILLEAPSIAESEGLLSCQVVSGMSEWEDVDASIGTYSPFLLSQQFLLQWEPLELRSLDVTFQKIMLDNVLGRLRGMVKREVLKFTPYPAITAAASLPLMCLNKIKEIDDPWCVCIDRAEQAGKLLARLLLQNHCPVAVAAAAGERGGRRMSPITLVGYGMGARVVYHCLDTLANEADSVSARGVVENAVLIGTPVSSTVGRWRAIRSVVAGRLVNCYATNDWILALLYRTKSYDIGVAGLHPVSIHTSSMSINTSSMSINTSSMSINTSSMSINTSSMSRACPSECTAKASTDSAPSETSKRDFAPPPQLAAAAVVREVENLDVSHLISSHADYPLALSSILDMVKL